METNKYYCVQLIGNKDSMKRMVVSIYLVNANKQQQTLKVCICDDLPHVVYAVGRLHKPAPGHDELESGLTLQVAHDRGLSISVSLGAGEDSDLCQISPPKVVIPAYAIWEPNAAFATDFQLQLTRMNVEGKLNVTITSQDDEGGDLPLDVSSHVHVRWRPNMKSGVRDMRRKWEESGGDKLPGSSALPRAFHKFQQPKYQNIDNLLKYRTAAPPTTSSKTLPSSSSHDKEWNVIGGVSPSPDLVAAAIAADEDDKEEEEKQSATLPSSLPIWARNGLNEDDFNYDDVVVV